MNASAIKQMGGMEDDSGSHTSMEGGGDDFGDEEGHDFGDDEGTQVLYMHVQFCSPATRILNEAPLLGIFLSVCPTPALFFTALSSPRSSP